jgi:uncharacterized DUF497 family protein
MADLRFIWDIQKEKINISKHSVSFTEAESVFYDEFAVEFFDDDHSDGEDRYLLLGLSHKLRLIILVFTLRDKGNTIRIISARKATKTESTFYPFNRK